MQRGSMLQPVNTNDGDRVMMDEMESAASLALRAEGFNGGLDAEDDSDDYKKHTDLNSEFEYLADDDDGNDEEDEDDDDDLDDDLLEDDEDDFEDDEEDLDDDEVESIFP